MCGNVGQGCGAGGLVDEERWTDAIFQFAEVSDKGLAVADYGGGVERGVDNTDIRGRLGLGGGGEW